MSLTNQQILDNAPEGAEGWTHYDGEDYLKLSPNKLNQKKSDCYWFAQRKEWYLLDTLPAWLDRETRTKSDIEALARLESENEALKAERDDFCRMYKSLLGDLSAGYGKLKISECEKHLEQFATEQKIGVIKKILDAPTYEFGDRPRDFGIRVECIQVMLRDLEVEQLRTNAGGSNEQMD